MAAMNQTTGEVLRSDPSAEARRGNLTTTDESLRMVRSPLSQLIMIRLEDDNFLMWKYQIENVVRGYGLEGFLFGTEQVPPKMVIDGIGILVPNPKFKLPALRSSIEFLVSIFNRKCVLALGCWVFFSF